MIKCCLYDEYAGDPFLETADVNTSNNHWTVRGEPGYFKVRKSERPTGKNLMQQLKVKK